MSSNAADPQSKVGFSNDVEEAVAVPIEKKSSVELRAVKDRQSLTQSAKAWDIDGDGQLDEAELALKDIDKTGKGTLSKEQMYQLMQQNLSIRQEMSHMKKVIYGLVGFTCVLALANVGMSFAAAFLAKDTTTKNGNIVAKNGEDALATGQTGKIFTLEPENDEQRRRREQQCAETNSQGTKTTSCTGLATDFVVSDAIGSEIGRSCHANNIVTLEFTLDSGSTVDRTVCPHPADQPAPVYHGRPAGSDGMTLGFNDGRAAILVERAHGSFRISGVRGQAGDACDGAFRCADGLVCDKSIPSVCVEPEPVVGAVVSLGTQCTDSNDCLNGLGTLRCDGGFCKGINGHDCTEGDTTCATGNYCANRELFAVPLGRGEAGMCACGNSDGCDSGFVCAGRCDVTDQPTSCKTEAELHEHCTTSMGSTWTCLTTNNPPLCTEGKGRALRQ